MRLIKYFSKMLPMLIACLISACSGSGSGDYSAAITEGRTAAKEIMDETRTTSLSIALVDGDSVVWAETFGTADTTTDKKPGIDTMYGIGSTSKMLATIAVMKLVDQGKVALDDPLVQHLPSFSMLSPDYTKITIRMLLNHSSGLPGTDYRNSELRVPMSGYAQQVLETLKTQHLKHAPGYLHVYCNDGFTLLELLVKAKSGKDFPWFVQDEILTPLGMMHSRYALEAFSAGSFARTYTGDQPNPQEFPNPYASGGLFSTPSDMGRLGMMLMNGGKLGTVRILSEDSVKEMAKDQTTGSFDPVPMKTFRYGLGWDTVAHPAFAAAGIVALVKGGDITDYNGSFIVVPGERMAVMVSGVAPFNDEPASRVGARILLRLLASKGRIPSMPQPVVPVLTQRALPSPGQFSGTEGLYAANDMIYRVSFPDADAGTLNIERYSTKGWQPRFKDLKFRTDGSFANDAQPVLGVRLVKAENRWYIALDLTRDFYREQMLFAQKIPSGMAPDQSWSALKGRRWLTVNESPEALGMAPELTLTTVPDAGSPLIVVAGDSFIPVNASAQSDDAGMMLLIAGLYGRDLNDLNRWTRGGETWLRYGSYLYRPLESVPLLVAGSNTISMGGEGYAEWRAVPGSAKSVSINGYGNWKLLDENYQVLSEAPASGSASIPSGAGRKYLLLYGLPYAQRSVSVQ